MIVFRKALSLQQYIAYLKNNGATIGFVPTMGALHNGHLSLISTCKKYASICVCSIFVNPTQFNDVSDYNNYPNTITEDIRVLHSSGCDILFLPSVDEMYPQGMQTKTAYPIEAIETVLEGKHRPGHFQGVYQVVERLLSIVQPHKLFMGQKDYQQTMVIRQLIETLQLDVKLVVVDTVRQHSGLALSSRNSRLSEAGKQNASAIYHCLDHIKKNYKLQPFDNLIRFCENYLFDHGFNKIDYITIADPFTLQPLNGYDPLKKHIALIAAFIGDVRLIDNMMLDDE